MSYIAITCLSSYVQVRRWSWSHEGSRSGDRKQQRKIVGLQQGAKRRLWHHELMRWCEVDRFHNRAGNFRFVCLHLYHWLIVTWHRQLNFWGIQLHSYFIVWLIVCRTSESLHNGIKSIEMSVTCMTIRLQDESRWLYMLITSSDFRQVGLIPHKVVTPLNLYILF